MPWNSCLSVILSQHYMVSIHQQPYLCLWCETISIICIKMLWSMLKQWQVLHYKTPTPIQQRNCSLVLPLCCQASVYKFQNLFNRIEDERNVCAVWFRDEFKKLSSHLLDNLSDCLIYPTEILYFRGVS